MYTEDTVAALVGCSRDDLAPFREGKTEKKGHQILWTPRGVEALLSELGIPAEKTPAGWAAEAPQEGAPRELVELVVYRTTQNPSIILCHVGGAVVRCRIRPGTAAEFRPRLVVTALREIGDLYRLIKKPRRPGVSP
jgi:hypothetical protein